MKKIFLLITVISFFTFSSNLFAQETKPLIEQQTAPRRITPTDLEPLTDAKVISSIPKCFCCNEKIYQLPEIPAITGGDLVCKDTKNIFNTISCEGASFNWTVTPAAITFSGQGTNQIQIDFSSIPAGTTVLTMTVEIRCGNRVVKNVRKVKICQQQLQTTIVNEGEDAMLHGLSGLQGNNYGNSESNVVSNWTFSGTPAVMYSVIKFTLPSGITSAMITSAKLSFKEHISPGNGNHAGQYGLANQPTAFIVKRVTSPWTEMGVTFSTMPSSTTANQVTVPAYSGGSAMDNIDIDVTQLVKDIINSGNNEGFLIRWNDNAANLHYRSRFFGSFECPTLSKRPILTLN